MEFTHESISMSVVFSDTFGCITWGSGRCTENSIPTLFRWDTAVNEKCILQFDSSNFGDITGIVALGPSQVVAQVVSAAGNSQVLFERFAGSELCLVKQWDTRNGVPALFDWLAVKERPWQLLARDVLDCIGGWDCKPTPDAVLERVHKIREKLSITFFDYESVKCLPSAGAEHTGEIGKGGNAVVYKAEFNDSGLGKKTVAIKLLLYHEGSEEVTVSRLLDEGVLHSQLDHPNILPFYGMCLPEKTPRFGGPMRHPLLAVQLMDGTLKEAFEQRLLENFETKVMVLQGTAEGLNYIHQKGVSHLDISPSNVLYRRIRDELRVKISDFGLSVVTDSDKNENSRLGGLLPYTAPEALLEEGKLDFGVDTWSFGVLCMFVADGSTPFSDKSFDQMKELAKSGALRDGYIKHAETVYGKDKYCGLGVVLMKVCIACFAEEPAARPSMAGVAAQLKCLWLESRKY